jgi:hypothetical protein
MPSHKEKTGILLLGIFLGILITGSVFWWQKSIYSVDWISFGRVKQFVNSFIDKPDDFLAQLKTRIISGRSTGKGKLGTSTVSDSLDQPFADSLSLNDSIYNYYNSQGLDYYIDYNGLPDSLLDPLGQVKPGSHADSTRKNDSLTAKFAKISEPVAFKRDEILAFRTIRVSGLTDSMINKSAFLDSLLTDDKNAKHIITNQIRVEFWKSPINYKGYKLSKEKLVLFGILDFDDVMLEFQQQRILLKTKNAHYLLKSSNNFEPLVPIRKSEKLIVTKKA